MNPQADDDGSEFQGAGQKAWETRRARGDTGTDAANKAWETRRARGDSGREAGLKAAATRRRNKARGALDAFFPEHREDCVRFLAESIAKADALTKDGWALTLQSGSRSLRLNVGRPQVIHIVPGTIHVEVESSVAPAEALESLPTERWMKQSPRSLSISLSPAELAQWGDAIRPAHEHVIEALAGTMQAPSSYRRAHSVELVEILAEESGRDLPQPAYVGPDESDKWTEVLHLCRDILEDREAFDKQERDYKLEIGSRVRGLLEATEPQAMRERLADALADPPNNLIDWRVKDALRKFVEDEPERATAALQALGAPKPVEARIEEFNAALPPEVAPQPGARLAVASLVFMSVDPERLPMYRPTPFHRVERILGWQAPDNYQPIVDQYMGHLEFANEFLRRLDEAGLPVNDMLDAQSLIWILATSDEPAIRRWRAEEMDEVEVAVPTPAADDDSLEAIAAALYVDPGFLRRCHALLDDKHQLVFYGPPGTGKTFIARRFAQWLTRDGGSVEIVQFHPSYSYEDFVEGYRPVVREGGLTYELRPGPLVQAAKRAAREPETTHILLIDEINRGNLPRILGELLFALEYREDPVRLMYSSDEEFRLPPNLWIMATMNTADRSIGLIDAAMRRRFHFVALFPDKAPLTTTLRDWLRQNASHMEEVADLVEFLNTRLRDRLGEHLQVGHSHFMRDGLDEALLDQIWEADILPFVEDQLFGQVEALNEFQLDAIRAGIRGQELPVEDDEGGNGEADRTHGVAAEDDLVEPS